MPEQADEIKLDNSDIMKVLIDAGVSESFMRNSITSGIILSEAVDFIKKLGVLSEFMQTLSISDGAFLRGLFEIRPKELGGNPFE